MIIVILIVSIFYLIMLSMILKAYYRDQEQMEKRCLILEKRIEEYRKDNKKILDEIIDEISDMKRNKK